ncbi:nuclear transport factor 2 family protein [Streptomyces sp. NPDC052496]|uniref:nuclear transport factor 2 family protein n=1 Tax=Streptomyces sp. NPDC052496 TaxID=3154951 RepID=UPI0034485461
MSDYAALSPARCGVLARRYYELVDAGQVEGLLALFSDDAVYRRPGYPALRGRAAMRAFYLNERVISHGRHELFAVIADGERVSVRGEFRGQLKDRSSVTVGFADFFTVGPDGLFTRRDTYFSSPAV